MSALKVSTKSLAQQSVLPTARPPLVTDIANQIKAKGGTIWLVEKAEHGFQFRADLGSNKLRIVVPPLFGNHPEVPKEANSLLFIVRDIASFESWLSTLS